MKAHRPYWRGVIVLALGLAAWLVLGLSARQQVADPTIEGTVFDADGNSLDGVLVEVWTAGKVKQFTTKGDGHYELPLDPAAPIDQIRFSRSDMDPEVVGGLPARLGQRLTVVLYKSGQSRSLLATDDTLHSFEYLAFAPLAAPAGMQKQLVADLKEKKYRDRLKALPIPKPESENQREATALLEAKKKRLEAFFARKEW